MTATKPLPKAWREDFEDDPNLSSPEFVARDYPEPITSDVPMRLRRGGVGRVQRPKECHHRAALYALNHPKEHGLQLVYGTYRGSIEHSWVELPGNITFDGTRMQFYRSSR